MRNLCPAFVLAFFLAPAWVSAADKVVPGPDTTVSSPAVAQDSAKSVPDTSKSAASAPEVIESASPDTSKAPEATAAPAASATPDASATTAAAATATAAEVRQPSSRALFQDYSLVSQQYLFGVLAQAVAGTLGFYIGSGLETAIAGEEEAHQGTLSFTGIRYDNFYGAFWGASIGGFLGSSLAVYFTGQNNEEDGGYFWTLFGTVLAGSGALYLADLMGVEEEVDWKPYLPLLAIPSAGGVLGFSISRWFSDRKRESIMGPDARIRVHPPRLAMALTPEGERFQLQALNLSF